MSILDTVDRDSIKNMSKEERLRLRSELGKEALKSNPKLKRIFVKANDYEREIIKGKLYQKIGKEIKDLSRYKVKEVPVKNITNVYEPGVPGQRKMGLSYRLTPPQKATYAPLLDDNSEKMYDLIENGTVDVSTLSEPEVAYFGQLAHMRESPLREQYQVRAREIWDRDMADMGEFSDTRIGDIIEGMAAPLTDLAREVYERKGEDTSYYDQYKAIQSIAYPNKVKWEKAGEVGGLFLGAGIGYAGLARHGLAKTLARHGDKIALRPKALASVAGLEFGLGVAYNQPSLVLQDADPNRIVSGLEAAAIGSAFGLAVDMIRPMRGMTYQEAMEHTRKLTGEKFHSRMARFQDKSKQSAVLRNQIDQSRVAKARTEQARGDYLSQARQERLARNELARTSGAQQRSMDDVAEMQAGLERQAVTRRQQDFDAARTEEALSARQAVADDIAGSLQARQLNVPARVEDAVSRQGAATTEEYTKKVRLENELSDVEQRMATIKGRRGESKKEMSKLQSRREVLRANQIAQELNPPLSKWESMAEEAMPGSVLGITPYANLSNLSKEELQTLLIKEGVGRGTVGTVAALTGEEDERLNSFLMGSLLWSGPMARKAAGVDKLKPPRWLAEGLESIRGAGKTGLVPLLQRLNDTSPVAYNMVTGVRLGEKKDIARVGKLVEPFFRTYRKAKSNAPWNNKYKMSKDQHDDLVLALDNGDAATRERILKAVDPSGEWSRQWEDLMKASRYIHQSADNVRVDGLKFLDEHFPRYVKDHNGLLQHKGIVRSDQYEKAYTEFLTKHKRKPTKMEVQELYSRVFREPQTFGAPSNTKQRQFTKLDKSDLEFYDDIETAFGKYMQSMLKYIHTRRALGYTKNSASFNTKRDILDGSVGETIRNVTLGLRNNGVLDADKMDEVHDLLRTSLIDYSPGPSAFWQGYRNLYYAGMIGNPGSTVTQASDVGIAATKDPIATFNVVKNAAKNLTEAVKTARTDKGIKEWWGDIKNPRKFEFNITDVGLRDIANDISSAGWTGKWLDLNTKASGFKMGDELMKNIHLSSAFERLQKQAKRGDKKYKALQQERFGKDFNELDKALKQGDADNRHVQHAIWNELVDVQPVIRESMPEFYSKLKTGRLMYSLKSFMLNHINFIRSYLIRNLNNAKTPKEYGHAMKELVTYGSIFGTAAFTANQVKDFMYGRTVSFSEAVMDALWQTMGLSKYNIYQLRDLKESFDSDRVAKHAFDLAVPHAPVSAVVEDLFKGEQESSRYFTPLGKSYYWHLGGGAEKERKRRARRARGGFDSGLGGDDFGSEDLGSGL